MDRSAHALHQIDRPGHVVDREQAGRGRLTHLQEMAEVPPAVARTHVTRAFEVERLVELGVPSGLRLESAGRSQSGAVTAQAGLHHAVELVDTQCDGFHE